MAKKVELIIESCESCPYFGYTGMDDKPKCFPLGKILLYRDYKSVTNKGSISVIYSECPLEDSE